MTISISQIKDKLVEKGLKVTPQRIAILEAIPDFKIEDIKLQLIGKFTKCKK